MGDKEQTAFQTQRRNSPHRQAKIGTPSGTTSLDARPLIGLAILVLGANLWLGLVVVPLYHLRDESVLLPAAAGVISIGILICGIVLRHSLSLLLFYPLSLLIPVLVRPALLSPTTLSSNAFILLGLSTAGFTIGVPWLLSRQKRPVSAPIYRNVDDATAGRIRWRRRRRMYLVLCGFCALLPWALLHGLYLRRTVFDDLEAFYPGRSPQAAVLFGVFALGLYLISFLLFVARSLMQHVRGDGDLQRQLKKDESSLHLSRPRGRFYVWVGLALLVTTMLFLKLSR
jgi:hypothetical protein